MNDAHDAVDAAINDADRLRRNLKCNKTPQVRSSEEKSLVKATALAWFNNYRPVLQESMDGELLHEVDNLYKDVLSASDRASARSRYDVVLKAIRAELSDVRSYTLTAKTSSSQAHTSDEPPDFSPLVADPKMQGILERRWRECGQCVAVKAPLAATVMMGGLLEGLLLARVNKESNKANVFGATKAPKDKKTGKPLSLKDWTLRHYIDVAHELSWISQSAKDVGEILRDYRNYIHPQKELSHGVQLQDSDAALFWEITKNIARQAL